MLEKVGKITMTDGWVLESSNGVWTEGWIQGLKAGREGWEDDWKEIPEEMRDRVEENYREMGLMVEIIRF